MAVHDPRAPRLLEWSGDGGLIIPVMIGVSQEAQIPTPKIPGMIMLLTFATSIGWILPINGQQNVLAFRTDTFEARDFIRVGLVITAAAYALLSCSPQPGGTGLAMGRSRRLRALLQERGDSGTVEDAVYRTLRHRIVTGLLRRAIAERCSSKRNAGEPHAGPSFSTRRHRE